MTRLGGCLITWKPTTSPRIQWSSTPLTKASSWGECFHLARLDLERGEADMTCREHGWFDKRFIYEESFQVC